MPRIKKEIFQRGVRMQHQFGETIERSDPFGFGGGTFEMMVPQFPRQRSPGNEIRKDGLAGYRPDPGAVQKPNGRFASLDGPKPDLVEVFARPMPVGTKRRLGPLKTDK